MSPSGDLEDEDNGPLEVSYRATVLDAPKETRMPLFVAVVVPTIGAFLVVSGAFFGGTQANILPGVLCFFVGFMLLGFQYGSLTRWIPRASRVGLVPPKRSVIQAARSLAPRAIPWPEIAQATLSAPIALAASAGAAEPALRAMVTTRGGKRIELSRRYYPRAFDQIIGELSSRGILVGWVPDISPAAAPPAPPIAGSPRGMAGTLRLWDGAKARRRASLGIAVVVGYALMILATTAYLSASFGAFPWWFLPFQAVLATWSLLSTRSLVHLRRMAVDVEIAPGRIRMGFDGRRELEGWRSTQQVRLVAVDPAPESVDRAEAFLSAISAPRRLKRRWRRQLDVWACTGGLLVITDDEIALRRWRGTVARDFLRHWQSGSAAVPPSGIPG